MHLTTNNTSLLGSGFHGVAVESKRTMLRDEWLQITIEKNYFLSRSKEFLDIWFSRIRSGLSLINTILCERINSSWL